VGSASILLKREGATVVVASTPRYAECKLSEE
jgi:hypothetical protein